jgi:hypothetical protein
MENRRKLALTINIPHPDCRQHPYYESIYFNPLLPDPGASQVIEHPDPQVILGECGW